MSNKYEHLVKNTAIFAIGTFGSKVLSFLIVPLYTYVLSTADYGQVDLFTTGIGLLVPFTTLLIQEALIRFMTANEVDSKCAVSNSMMVFLFGIIMTVCGIPLYHILIKSDEHIGLFVILLILTSYNNIFGQYLRASGNTIAFSINGVLVTVVTLITNLLFLVVFKWGILGYFYALILAQLVAACQATVTGKIFSNFSIRNVSKDMLKQMLRYSIPLIPNNLMWWVMNAGDKYIINFYMGDEANGLYSLAMKIPTILSLIYTIFMQAWQLSAIEEHNKEGQAEFYKNVFVATSALLTLITSLIIIFVKPLYLLIINTTFIEAWKYVPFLCIATILNCYATFAGITYVVNKKSSKSFYTTFIGAGANLFFNFLLIKPLGLYGVAIGTVIGYIAVFLVRARDSRRELRMSFDGRRTICTMAILCVQAIAIILIENIWIYGFETVTFVLLIFLYRKEIGVIKGILIKKFKR